MFDLPFWGFLRELVRRAPTLDEADLKSSNKLKAYRAPLLLDLLKEQILFNLGLSPLNPIDMDTDAMESLTKGLYAQKKRKGMAPCGSSKRAKEEKKKEVEIKVAELEVRMLKSISKVATRAIEEFKASFEMKDLNIAFGQKMFIKGFELCEDRVVWKFFELDLSFLEEEPNEEAGSFGATADPFLTEVVFESFELATEVPKPMQEPKVISEASVKPVPKLVVTPGVPSSSAAFPSEVGGLW
ncbi:hypothetical protein COCNU_scaffold033979G000010 [Cocos nucifera]|nr:hypothetical protein [Cocos nucifera]